MQLFQTLALVAAAATAVVAGPTLMRRDYDAAYYKSEGYTPRSRDTGYGDYKVPKYEFPPVDERIKECAHRFGHDLHKFFHEIHVKLEIAGEEIHGFFHRLHEKLSAGWHDFVDKIHHKADCLAFKLHVQWRRFKSDAERVKFWLHCERLHFKHWYEYRKAVCEGKKKIRSKFAHEMMCALREFEALEKDAYEKRYNECKLVADSYEQTDEDYITIVGREKIEIDGEVLDLRLGGKRVSA